MNRTALPIVVLAFALSAAAHERPRRLPLGDGRTSPAARAGYLMACGSFPGGGGAHRAGDWISNGTWSPRAKPIVEGDVAWPGSTVTIEHTGAWRVIRANSLPRHRTGEFPIRPGTRAYAYDRNPNRIAAQPVVLRLPARPRVAARPSCVPMGLVGFAVSGVAIFNAVDLQGRDAPAHEIQDRCNGHPERTRQYHYHDWSPCLAVADRDAPVGWMLDGFPILGPVDRTGKVNTNADLDRCHGTVGPVRIDGRTVRTYHYRFTYEFPYSIGCFSGTPVRFAARNGAVRPATAGAADARAPSGVPRQ